MTYLLTTTHKLYVLWPSSQLPPKQGSAVWCNQAQDRVEVQVGNEAPWLLHLGDYTTRDYSTPKGVLRFIWFVLLSLMAKLTGWLQLVPAARLLERAALNVGYEKLPGITPR